MSIINVFNLTSGHQTLFVELMRHLMERKIKIILINEKHIVSDELSFQHNIIVANNVVNQLEEAIHFYVTDEKPLGGGSNGDVYSIIAQFCLTPEGKIQQQALPQSLVVKFSKKVVCSKQYNEYCDDLYELEVSNTRAMSHLGFVMSAKKRHNNQLVSAIIMKKQPGVELFEIINKILSLEYVSSQFQLQLTIALLSAYQAQLSSLLLIHGDIKPENIMVDLGMDYNELGASSHNKILADFVPPKIDCAFIDVERAKRYLTPYDLYIPLGSKKYLAPELNAARERGKADTEIFECEKIDIYSLGKVLSYLWRAHVVLASFLIQDENKVYSH